VLNRQSLEDVLRALGDLLADRGSKYEVVAIGGGALSLLGLIERSTFDIDVVALHDRAQLRSAEPLPDSLTAAIRDVGDVLGLDASWMNNGPTSLMRFGLPDGFLERCIRREYGGLTVLLAARFDQIHLKFFAAVDGAPGDKHHGDLQTLAPTRTELEAAYTWARTHDPSAGFDVVARGVLATFGVEVERD
jgi:hypothetical protein